MKRTVMVSDKAGKVTIETGDNGTQVLDPQGVVLADHGTDRHEEMVAIQQAAGLGVVQEGDVRPEDAADAPPPSDDDKGDGFSELDLGASS
jgi:hypothetical protein